MPLDTTNFHPQGPVKSVDLMQFYNLFTGLMSDQPIAFSNSVAIGGNQGLTTVPLRVYGATGQNTNLIDLYPDHSSAQPGFGFSAVGRFAWGPGGVSPQDTFLSRIALQNGHGTDTPGLLITPSLEVTGSFTAQDLNATRHVRAGDTIFAGTAINATNQTISTPGYAGLQLRTVASGGIFLSSYAETYVGANLYNNATGWHRNQSGVSAAVIQVSTTGFNFLAASSSAPDPVPSFFTCMAIDGSGNISFPGNINSFGGSIFSASNIGLKGPGVFIRNQADTQYATLTVGNIDIRTPGGSTAISWGDGSHYLQYAPAGDVNLLAWTHNFQCANLQLTASYITNTAGSITYRANGQHYFHNQNDTLFAQIYSGAVFANGGLNVTGGIGLLLQDTATGQIGIRTNDNTLRMRFQDQFTLANGTNRTLLFASSQGPTGIYIVIDNTDGASAIVGGSNPTTTIWLNHGSACSTVQGTGGTFQVFYSGGLLYLQNNRGSTHNFLVMAICNG